MKKQKNKKKINKKKKVFTVQNSSVTADDLLK